MSHYYRMVVFELPQRLVHARWFKRLTRYRVAWDSIRLPLLVTERDDGSPS